MIKPEQIPYEVKMRLRAVLLDGETDEAVAIAAAINVWPGRFSGNAWPDLAPTIVLPLTQENNNGSD
jgi:hypothetical protein